MNEGWMSAAVAGGVSLLVSVIGYLVSLRRFTEERERHEAELEVQRARFEEELVHERRRQERELERRLTERLYELRIQAYKAAFSLTQPLQGDVLHTDAFTREVAQQVAEGLKQWATGDAAFLLSRKSSQAYYRLRDALVQGIDAEELNEAVRRKIWKGKNALRSALRHDLRLLFAEDEFKANDEAR